MYNPLFIVGARVAGRRQRRARVGAEFGMCPDGTFVKGNPTPEKCGTPPSGGVSIPREFPINRTDWTRVPNGGGFTPPPGTSGGGTPPPYGGGSGGSGGGTPYTPPYTPPATVPTTPGCAPPAQVCPENQKRYVMPFIPNTGFTATVTAGSTVEFVGKPQKLFKPDRLMIASTIAPFFDVISLLIANIPQSLSAGAVAADIYSEVATDMEMSFDQAYPGIDVILTARNKSSVTQTFQVQLAGWAVG